MTPARTETPPELVVGQAWRTRIYRELATPLDRVLGGATAKQLKPLGLNTVAQLLHHLPRRYFAGTELSDLRTLVPGEEVAVMAQILSVRTFGLHGGAGHRGGGKPRLEAVITDDHRGELVLAFFGAPHLVKYWEKQLQPGARGIFAGKVNEFNHRMQLAHPDFVIVDKDGNVIGGAKVNEVMASSTVTHGLVGLYPATQRVRTWLIADCVRLALGAVAGAPDPLPEPLRRQAGVLELGAAFRAVHAPGDRAEIEPGLDRLRFDEAFGLQLTMARRRADAAAHAAIARPHQPGGLLDEFDARLPFTLTAGQVEVSEVILGELAGTRPMQRLLQGEVGSGKTLVAIRAMLTVIDNGGQAALLAPTEVLAAQHWSTITRLLGDLGEAGTLNAAERATSVALLTGSMGPAARRQTLARIASGDAGVVVGTHALLGAGVEFADLGLVVVDEQHRFGVEQRAALSAKAAARPHVLVMTATPIPRSVAMTVFGDLETATLRELPAGRAEVSTVVVDANRHPAWVDRTWARIVEEVAAGRQAYVVCARISSADPSGKRGGGDEDLPPDEEEREPAVAAEDLFAELSAGPLRDLRVELLHGQLPGEQKDAVMSRFAAGECDVLVSTTVIEVGVDVPNASVMVIADADRFGISQLHQLRGRIGRGGHPGICLLISRATPDSPAWNRLTAVARTRDGFELAEIDLEQRREGDVLGAQQSGEHSSLRLLRVIRDTDLIMRARQLAEACVSADPELADPGLADMVDWVEREAAGDWLERT